MPVAVDGTRSNATGVLTFTDTLFDYPMRMWLSGLCDGGELDGGRAVRRPTKRSGVASRDADQQIKEIRCSRRVRSREFNRYAALPEFCAVRERLEVARPLECWMDVAYHRDEYRAFAKWAAFGRDAHGHARSREADA